VHARFSGFYSRARREAIQYPLTDAMSRENCGLCAAPPGQPFPGDDRATGILLAIQGDRSTT
jgi:hypothetical protein